MSVQAPWEKDTSPEDKNILERLLNGTASIEEIFGPSAIAPAVEPAAPRAVAPVTTPPAGPIVPPLLPHVQHNVGPGSRYADLFDQAVLDDAKSRVAQYDHEKIGRYDPFEPSRLADQLEREAHSQLLNCRVTTFVLACSHAVLLTEVWKAEDESIVELGGTIEDQRAKKREEADRKAQAVEVARQKWKEAILEAKEGKKKWDDYVAEMKRRFQIARDG
ncbi:MAG TPA: hypothetical protein VN039_02875 [Nitrospira sp.]|nr:hypothetical protein [Nitrospira sp.]